MSKATASEGNYVAMEDAEAPMADAQYLDGGTTSRPPARAEPVQDRFYVRSVLDTPRKQVNAASACCCCMITAFLLLFFLIPRGPHVTFETLTVYASGRVDQELKFRNFNFYSMDVSSVYLEVGLKEDDGNYYLAGKTTDDTDFSISSLSSTTKVYRINIYPDKVVDIVRMCANEERIDMAWQGEIDLKALQTSYDDYEIGTWYTSVQCVDDD
mmetsp:Transcript_7485/g.28321  ORF Transcript_7485/g.28321 Transcript_7485/m.28321 type:complete len:213 (-) Transcript_7485:153-791(-)